MCRLALHFFGQWIYLGSLAEAPAIDLSHVVRQVRIAKPTMWEAAVVHRPVAHFAGLYQTWAEILTVAIAYLESYYMKQPRPLDARAPTGLHEADDATTLLNASPCCLARCALTEITIISCSPIHFASRSRYTKSDIGCACPSGAGRKGREHAVTASMSIH